MKFTRHFAAAAGSILLAAGLATAGGTAFASEATAAPGVEQGGPDGHGEGPDGGPHHGPEGFGGPGPGVPGPGMPPGDGPFHGGPFGGMPPLHGLKLTEAQQDKLFAIMHAQAPARRDHEKALRKAQQALHALGRADKFDDAKANSLARDLGQAVSAAALLQARTEAQVLAVLTPEQRAELREHRRHGPMGPHDGPHGQQDGAQGQPDRAQGQPDRQ